MSDVQQTQNTLTEEQQVQAIASLKKQADRLGVTYKSNVSVATLQKAIQAKLDGEPEESVGDSEVDTKTKQQSEAEKLEALHKKAMKLVRVIITPMEATKAANLDSEIFCAGNSKLGTVKRLVAFGEPWHVEEILLNSIREKKYQMFTTKKNARGIEITSAKLVPAYAISVLPDLTDEELKELADHQIRTRSLVDED